MAGSNQQEVEKMNAEEPVGIVISRGSRDEPAPAFWAYVWAVAPETDRPIRRHRAA